MTYASMLLLAAALLVSPAPSYAADALNDEQKAAVEEVVRKLLIDKDPSIIFKAAENYKERMEKETSAKAKEAVKGNLDRIQKDPDSPVAGNPKGDVTVVEFFDYNCGYCKMARDGIAKLLDEDKNVRVVFKELPIFGESSVEIAKIALAGAKQGKYVEFHMALMSAKERMTREAALKIAGTIGLDVKKLEKDSKDEKIAKILETNQQLAKDVSIYGTPAFVVGDKLFSGAIPYADLKKAVEAERSAAKK